MPSGRPNTPTEIKRARGTYRADREPKGEALIVSPSSNIPEPLQPLGERGLDFWQVAFSSAWISSATDRHLVALVAETLDERESLRLALAVDFDNRQLRASLREVDKQLISGLSMLGFSPSDRARLGLAEVKAETKLEELLRRKRERDNLRG